MRGSLELRGLRQFHEEQYMRSTWSADVDPDACALLLLDDVEVLIDIEDTRRVEVEAWRVTFNRAKVPYIYSSRNGVGYLHRFLLGFGDLKSMQAAGYERCYVDHKNHNTLDCRKSNLRPCTQAENSANSRCAASNPWNFRGIKLHRGTRWMAQLGKEYLGVFKTPEEAARAYDVAAKERFGEFARLNFPESATHGSIQHPAAAPVPPADCPLPDVQAREEVQG